MRWHIGIVVTACLIVAASCGGGGSDAGAINGGSGGSSTLAANFVPDQPSPGDETVALALGGTSGALVTVRVNVSGVVNLFTAEFQLTYDSQQVEFVNWSPGTVLESGGNPPSYLVRNLQPGLLDVAASRLDGATGGVDVSAPQPVINLLFRATEAGSSPVAFSRASLYDAQDPPQPIPGLSWFGGAITAN